MTPVRDSHEIAKSVHLKEGSSLAITGLLSIITVGFRPGCFTNKYAA